MRVLSRIFRCFCVAVGLAFATLPAMSAYDMKSCTDDGFVWDSTNQQCCWHYYVINDNESICINENNFSSYFSRLGCQYGEAALYIDANGEPQCCPSGTVPDDKTHSCICENGGWFDGGTGQCRLFALARSTFCDEWDTGNRDQFGYFFDYLLGGKLGRLTAYRSKYTCTAVISKMNQVGLSDVVTGVEDSCVCKCVDPMLSFNPSAAEDCVDGDGAACQNVCVDASDGKNYACPLGQQKYLVNNEWTCCMFYDPNSGTCIQNVSEWSQYINSLGFESGGGYVNAEGVPVECPVDDEVVVNRETGMCACRSGGWFDVTTGTCMKQLKVRYTYRRSAGGERTYNYTQTGTGAPATQTANGYLDTFFHQVYNPNGAYVYTSLPVTNMNTTPYVYTTTSSSFPGRVESFYYVTLTFMGNGGTFSGGTTSDLKNIRVGSYSVAAQTPTRSGYTFNGWWTSATGGIQVTSANLTDVTADTIYYAHWTENATPTITLNWDENGGNAISNGSCTYGGNLVLPAAPTRSGYTFLGWRLADGTQRNAGTTVSGGCTSTYVGVTSGTSTAIQAQWSVNTVTITLNKNGGTGTVGNFTGTTSATFGCPLSNSTCDLPTWGNNCNITNGTKIFVGWATSSNATSGTYTITTPSANTTYYAVWKDTTCSVTNGTGSATTPSNNAPRCVVTCNTGYQTSGTYTGTAGNPSFSYTCNKNCYQISFDNTTNGGIGGTQNVWLYRNTSDLSDTKNCKIYSDNSCSTQITSITVPTKPNGSFGGYYSTTSNNANNGNYYDEGWFGYDGTSQIAMGRNYCATTSDTQGYFNDLVGTWGFNASSTPSITLRALYGCDANYHEENGECVADTVTVSYDANGGSGSHALSTTCNSGESCALQTWNDNPQNPCNITNGNKIFLGWSTDPNATTATYTSSGIFTSDTLLYAVWATPTCSVTNGTGTITTPSSNAPRCVVTCNTGYSTSGTYTGTAGGTSVSYTCGVGQYLLTLTDNKQTSNTRSLFEIYGNRWASNSNGQPSGTSITTVPGMTRAGYKFRGYYASDLDDVTSNTSSTTGFKMKTVLTNMADCAGTDCTETLTSNTEWFAAWAQDCEITNGECSVTIGTLGQVTYSASCNDGYTLSGGNTSRPTCTPISYTVTFGANGGSGAASPTSVTCVYDQDCTLAAKGTLAKSNATFDGWNTATDGSGDGYLESDTVQNLTTTSGATIPLYAVWRTSGCSAGQYLDDGTCVPCPAGYYCTGGDAIPVICPVNKYSTGGAVSCSSCTGGLTTSPIADARYHDEAADCGRKLHIGAYEIRLKSIPSTGSLSSLVPSPALRFNYAGNANGRPDFYANMSTIASPMRVTTANNDGTGAISTTGSGDKFKTRYNNTNYYVCDDVTCVTE